MAKQRVDLLLDPDLVALADTRAAELRWSRTTLVTAALEDFLDSAKRAVSDQPARTVPKNPVDDPTRRPGMFGTEPAKEAEMDWQEIEMARRRAKR